MLTVGADVYPVPGLVTWMPRMEPAGEMVAVAVAVAVAVPVAVAVAVAHARAHQRDVGDDAPLDDSIVGDPKLDQVLAAAIRAAQSRSQATR